MEFPYATSLISSLGSGFGTQLMLVGSGVILARMLGPLDRGYLALLSLWPSILWQLGSLGVQVSASYYIALRPGNARAIVRMLVKLGAIQLIVLVALNAGIVLWFIHGRPAYLLLPAVISLGMLPPSLARQYALGVLQGQRKFTAFNIGRFLPSALTTAGAALLWITHTRSLVAATSVVVVTGIVSAVVTLLCVRGLREANIAGQSVPSLRQMLGFGLKALPSSAYPVESFKLDQLFAGLALSPAALGVYVVASSFTNLPRFASQSVGMVSYPNVAAERNSAVRHTSVWHFFWITAAIVTPIVVVLIAAMGLLLPFFFGSVFTDAIPVAQILLVAGLFLGLRRTWFDGLRGAGYPLVGTVSEAASWVVLLLSMFLLAPRLNVIGVAIAVLLSAVTSLSFVLVADRILTRRGAWDAQLLDPNAVQPEALQT